ncbi:hypothetical protein [Streptomyces pinistramenti]|uniref:hypothetical protein n=1 Tax=Streptomyces pinistramenti TaxID=2884812 RepID=UPI001D08467B|nr:hypothetical protein [Streptomyces pinistramenti]MCB5911970.1 hypothetical protein [Streptomyces pinistramenti]
MPKRPTADPQPQPTIVDSGTAADALDQELAAAGFKVRTTRSPDGTITLSLDRYDAQNLAHVIQQGVERYYRVAEALREALHEHGIEIDPGVLEGRFVLGKITIPQVDALALALGAPPQPGLDPCPDAPGAEIACQRLADASVNAIGHRIVGDLHLYCRTCDDDPTLDVLPLTFDTARRLTKALKRARQQPSN